MKGKGKKYNHTYLDYRANDENFEVKDHKGNIVFSISYNPSEGAPFVSIAGYFNSPTSVLVLNNNLGPLPANGHYNDNDFYRCFNKTDSNWLTNSEIEIAKIKSTF